MAILVTPDGLLLQDIYNNFRLSDMFKWQYEPGPSGLDDDFQWFMLAISEGTTPDVATEWVWDRAMDLATFKTGFLAYPPSVSLFKPGIDYYWDIVGLEFKSDPEDDWYYFGEDQAKKFSVP